LRREFIKADNIICIFGGIKVKAVVFGGFVFLGGCVLFGLGAIAGAIVAYIGIALIILGFFIGLFGLSDPRK